MLKRILTGVIGLPFVLLIVYLGGLALFLTTLIFAIIGLRELYMGFSGKNKPIHLIGYLFTVLYFGVIFLFGIDLLAFAVLGAFIISIQCFIVLCYKKTKLEECVQVVYGFFYVSFLMSFILLVRGHEFGLYFVWLILTSAFGSDTFAYFTGTMIGKTKLVNSPSPSKSLEGVIGGVIGAGISGLLIGFIVSQLWGGVPNIIVMSVIISVIGAVFCVIGDMAASAIKRNLDIKDFGTLIPGHGGVLDRIDSTIFVAPVVYLLMNVMLILW